MSYQNRTVAGQQATLAVLTRVGAAFPHLPAAEMNISRVYLDRLTISLHDDIGDFETWRVALGVPHESVEYDTLPGVPALIAYNKLQGDVAKMQARLEGFADEFSSILSRQIDQHGTRDRAA